MILKSTLKDIFRISMNQFLLVILLVFSFKSQAQCPPGGVAFETQEQVDNFAINYPSCTTIDGGLGIFYGNITSLEPLSNLTTIAGHLYVRETNLTTLEGLNNITSIGLQIDISINNNLTNLDALSSVTTIGDFLAIEANPSLTDISGIQNIDPLGIGGEYGLYITHNSSLSVCHIENICTYLQGSGIRTISANANNCNSEAQVLSACLPCPITESLTVSNITSNSAILNWQSEGTEFEIQWGSQGFTLGQGTTVSGIEDNSYNLTTLNSDTQYQFYVRTICEINQSDWAGPFSFTTLTQCPAGNVTFYSQAQVNTFATNYPNCTEISGYLLISGNDITDLSPLSNLTSVGGYLYIYYNSNLTNLDGLSNLTSVGGYLYIGSNSVLTNLDGLSNLTSIGSYLEIYNNYNLTNLDGLSNLTNIGADLAIYYNLSLTDISGLQNIDPTSILSTYYGVGLYIVDNASLSVCNLPNFCAYLQGSGLRTISGNAGDCVSVVAVTTACTPACDAPTNLTATNITSASATLGWTSTGNNFDIEWGTQGFTQGSGTMVTDIAINSYNLTSLSSNTQYQFYVRQDCSATQSDWAGPFGFTTPSQCPAGGVSLTSQAQVNAFATNYPNCTEISSYLLISGSTITDLSPLSNLTSVGGYLYIYDNLSLTNLDGLSNLTSVGEHLDIGYNSNLTNLDGLSNLTSIGSHLAIFSNYNLTNLDGLSNLTSIGADLAIDSNPSLTDISGLQNIDPSSILSTYGVGLYIGGNASLSVCNLDNFCTYLQGSGLRNIWGNAVDCISEQAVLNACEQSGGCNSYTIWNGTSWSNGLPDTTKRAIIEGDLTISNNMSACELLLNSGILTINSNASLTVNGVIENTQTSANFIVHSGANLIQVDDVDNIGEITTKRNTTIKHLDYTIWSSPVLNQDLQEFSPETLPNRIRVYNGAPAVNNWVVTTGDFEVGKGYMFRAPNVFDDGYYPNAYTWTGNFIGIPHNGNITTAFTNTGKFQSVGNPYPSNIDREALHAANQNLGALYFWTNTNSDYANNNWKVVNRVGESVVAVGDDNSDVDIISVGQGFLASVAGNTTEVVFNNTMRSASTASFYRTASSEAHKFRLNLVYQDQVLTQSLVSYNSASTNGLDLGIDSELINYTGSALYSLIAETEGKYVIQGRALPFADTDEVALGFRAVTAGEYTISLTQLEGVFAEGQTIYLKDTFTGTEHNLSASNYEFVSELGEFDNRFEIIYTTESLSVNQPNLDNSWVVFKQNNTFQIQTQGFEMIEVTVYDMLGRVVYKADELSTHQHQFSGLKSNQILIVQIKTTDNKELTKKVVN